MKGLRLVVITGQRLHVYEGRTRIVTFEWHDQNKLREDVEWARTARHEGDGSMKKMILPADPAERKGIPITTGVLDYFPLAIAEVARVSKSGNDQHNPGEPLHWDKTKSLDHADCIPRHLIDRGSRDTDGERHSAKLAWRALALLETELEEELQKPQAQEVADDSKARVPTGFAPTPMGVFPQTPACDRTLRDYINRIDGEGSGHPD